MRRFVRNPRKHELFDLYGTVGQELKMSLADNAYPTAFKAIVEDELAKQENDNRLWFGKRTEEMFGYMVAAMGRCEMIRKEDAGSGYARDSEILIPDYHLYTADGGEYLVEVKNRHNDKFVVRENYITKLRTYADIAKVELRLAIYWSRSNMWSFFSPEIMPLRSGQFTISEGDAVKNCELSRLGDFLVITEEPLVVKALADPAAPRSYDRSSQMVRFTVLRSEFYSRGVLVTDEFEAKLAEFLYHNGVWVYREPVPIMDGQQLVGIEQECRLTALPEGEKADLVFLGRLSSMLSWKYVTLTSSGGRITALTPAVEPGEFAVRIPRGYIGKQLSFTACVMRP